MKAKMIAWMADCLWAALAVVAGRFHDYLFGEERQARIRFWHRERWWKCEQRAMLTGNKRDDMRAKAWAIQFGFQTPPQEAIERGDLDPAARRLAMDAIEKARKTYPAH